MVRRLRCRLFVAVNRLVFQVVDHRMPPNWIWRLNLNLLWWSAKRARALGAPPWEVDDGIPF